MLFIIMIIFYIQDCKELGKENLAVKLSERIFCYLIFVVVPMILAIII